MTCSYTPQLIPDLYRAGGLRFDTSPRGVTLGTAQRMIAHYESRVEKAPAALSPRMVPALKASADELLGIKPLTKGKKPGTQLHRRLQRIEKLDSKAKRQITQLLDTSIEGEELKQRVNAQGA